MIETTVVLELVAPLRAMGPVCPIRSRPKCPFWAGMHRLAFVSEQPARLGIPEHVATEIVDGEAILLHLKTGRYFTLNATATRIVELARTGQTAEEVADALAGEFSGDPQTIRADVDALVTRLVDSGLLTKG